MLTINKKNGGYFMKRIISIMLSIILVRTLLIASTSCDIANPIVGSWETGEGGTINIFNFAEDGTFTIKSDQTDDSNNYDTNGKYTVDKSAKTITMPALKTDTTQLDIVFNYVLHDNILELTPIDLSEEEKENFPIYLTRK